MISSDVELSLETPDERMFLEISAVVRQNCQEQARCNRTIQARHIDL
jgi:hypothetical protein